MRSPLSLRAAPAALAPLILLPLLISLSLASATLGADESHVALPAAWACLKSNGYTFGIIRTWESTGNPDRTRYASHSTPPPPWHLSTSPHPPRQHRTYR
jgi:hypothetical protein